MNGTNEIVAAILTAVRLQVIHGPEGGATTEEAFVTEYLKMLRAMDAQAGRR
jgi:hypothetical protein